jgi:hypothetical protein
VFAHHHSFSWVLRQCLQPDLPINQRLRQYEFYTRNTFFILGPVDLRVRTQAPGEDVLIQMGTRDMEWNKLGKLPGEFDESSWWLSRR